MKYFSVSYFLTPEDYSYYDKKAFKSLLIARCKRLAILLIVAAALCIFYKSLSAFVFYVAVCILTGIVIPQLTNREFLISNRKESLYLNRETTVDFYSDHLVVKNEADADMKSHFLRHYGFDNVRNVEENDEYFCFLFKTNNILIIPKRALNEENCRMIENLIENLFKNIYINW